MKMSIESKSSVRYLIVIGLLICNEDLIVKEEKIPGENCATMYVQIGTEFKHMSQ